MKRQKIKTANRRVPSGGRNVRVRIEDMDPKVWLEIKRLAKAAKKSPFGFIKGNIIKHVIAERQKKEQGG